HVHGELGHPSIGVALRPVGRRRRPARDRTLVLARHHDGEPRVEPALDVVGRSIAGLERGHSIFDPLVVDPGDPGGILPASRAYPDVHADGSGEARLLSRVISAGSAVGAWHKAPMQTYALDWPVAGYRARSRRSWSRLGVSV